MWLFRINVFRTKHFMEWLNSCHGIKNDRCDPVRPDNESGRAFAKESLIDQMNLLEVHIFLTRNLAQSLVLNVSYCLTTFYF